MNFLKDVQLGKKGITEEFVKDIDMRMEKYRNIIIKINVLKSARENGRLDVKKYAEELTEKLGKKYTARVIGFSILLRKWRKARE
jgi:RNA-binding protein YhbY